MNRNELESGIVSDDTAAREALPDGVTLSEYVKERNPGADADKAIDQTQERSRDQRGRFANGNESEGEGRSGKRGGWQRRIDKLTREKSDLAARVAQFESGAGARQPANDPEEAATREAAAGAADRPAEEQQRHEYETSISRHVEAVNKQSDREALIAHAEQVKVPPPVLGAIHAALMEEGDRGGEVLVELLRRPELCARLGQMAPNAAYREMVRFAAMTGETSRPRPQSSAPAPIKPVGGSNASTVPDPMKLSLSQYIARRNKGAVR